MYSQKKCARTTIQMSSSIGKIVQKSTKIVSNGLESPENETRIYYTCSMDRAEKTIKTKLASARVTCGGLTVCPSKEVGMNKQLESIGASYKAVKIESYADVKDEFKAGFVETQHLPVCGGIFAWLTDTGAAELRKQGFSVVDGSRENIRTWILDTYVQQATEAAEHMFQHYIVDRYNDRANRIAEKALEATVSADAKKAAKEAAKQAYKTAMEAAKAKAQEQLKAQAILVKSDANKAKAKAKA